MRARLRSARYFFTALSCTLLCAGIMGYALFLAGPWFAAGSLLMGLLYAGAVVRNTRRVVAKLKRHPASHPFSPNLGRIMEELSAAAGEPAGSIALADYNVAEDTVKDLNKTKKKYAPQYVLNAAAAYSADDVILVSEPMLQLLDDDEEKAILGHELAHHLLRHTKLSAYRNFAGTITSFACLGILLRGAFATGWQAFAAGAGATIAVSLLFRFIHLDGGEVWVRPTPGMSAYDLMLNDRVKAMHRILISLAFAAGVTYFNHAYAGLYAITWLISLGNRICTRAGSRNQEYEADAAAVRLTASPLALATGLRKMKMLEERGKQKILEKHKYLPSPWPFHRLRHAVFSTHPPTPRRVERLCAIAQAAGFPAEAVAQAKQGPLTLPEGCEIPYDVIKHYLRQL